MTYDVAIAGAGLAGSTLAAILAGRGARVAVFDAATFPRDKLCGEFLSPEAWGPIDRLGLTDAIALAGYHPVRRARLTFPSGRAIDSTLGIGDGQPGIALGRGVLDALLLDAARSAGADVFEGWRVGGPRIENGRVTGLLARPPGAGAATEPVTAAVVVAADGRHSALVRATGAIRERSRGRPPLFGLKRHLRPAADADGPPQTVALHLMPGGYVGSCPVEGGRVNLCGLLPESWAAEHRGDLDALATSRFAANPALDRLARSAAPDGPWKAVAGVRVEVARPERPGIFYAGDCQGTVDPLGGQGMTMALLGAEGLAPFVIEALAETPRRDPSAFARLQEAAQVAWHGRFDRRVALCRAFHQILVRPVLLERSAPWLGRLAGPLLGLAYRATRDGQRWTSALRPATLGG